jgi:hypothetical protein
LKAVMSHSMSPGRFMEAPTVSSRAKPIKPRLRDSQSLFTAVIGSTRTLVITSFAVLGLHPPKSDVD